MKTILLSIAVGVSLAFSAFVAGAAEPTLPRFEKSRTAIVITDPQNEFLAENGKLYGLLAENLKELGTIQNIETLMKAAKSEAVVLAVDLLIYNALDVEWSRAGALQRQLLDMKALQRVAANDPKGFEGSGADFYAPYKRYIYDGKTIVVAPHKLYGPESNDLIYQLRARGIDTVILGGMVANLCVDSHMRALMENGFKVYVVKDAVAAPGPDAYKAALVNYTMIANGVLTTKEAVAALRQ
jgi:nicotinamidase-related amidase